MRSKYFLQSPKMAKHRKAMDPSRSKIAEGPQFSDCVGGTGRVIVSWVKMDWPSSVAGETSGEYVEKLTRTTTEKIIL